MTAHVEHFEVECPYCRKPVTVAWQHDEPGKPQGVIRGPYTLIADWVYHDDCWDRLVAEHPP